MKAPVKDEAVPEISAVELAATNGFLFGFPTRYGRWQRGSGVVEGERGRWREKKWRVERRR